MSSRKGSGCYASSGSVSAPRAGELHPIAISLTEDSTEVRCTEPGCGFCEDARGPGFGPAVTHAADHTMVTGHTVIERHVVVSVVRELRVNQYQPSQRHPGTRPAQPVI